jgi:signal transduction histidine kinase
MALETENMIQWITIPGNLVEGYHVASGPSKDYPYGALDRQRPIFKSRTRTKGSSGLGLAITKQLVLAHEDTFTAESEIGKGTTFIIELPT